MIKDAKYTVRMTSAEKKEAEKLAMKLDITQIKNRGQTNERKCANLSRLFRTLVYKFNLSGCAEELTESVQRLSKEHNKLTRLCSNLNQIAHTYNKMNLSYDDVNIQDYPRVISQQEMIENKKLLQDIFKEVKELRKHTQIIHYRMQSK